MLRKFLVAAVTMLSLTFGVLAVSADAQTSTTTPACSSPEYNTLFEGRCVNDLFQPQLTPEGAPVVPATTDPAPTADTAGNALAFTGAESSVLGYIGAGMVGVGALAIGLRRKIVGDSKTD